MVSKQHYKEIAYIISKTTETNNYINKKLLVDNLASFFERDNKLFNRSKFEEACNDLEK